MEHTEPAKGNGKQPRGRKNRDKQEAVIKTDVITERIEELERLYTAAGDASTALNDAIKKAAEDSGLLASVVRKLVVARASDKFAEKQREAAQLVLVFDEVGQ